MADRSNTHSRAETTVGSVPVSAQESTDAPVKSKVLVVGESVGDCLQDMSAASCDVVQAQTPLGALDCLSRDSYDAVYFTSDHLKQAYELGKLLQNEQILEGMPDGVVLLDSDNQILWSNGRLCQWSGQDSVIGKNFYVVLDSPEILGPDFCPFHTALATGTASSSTLRSSDHRYYHVHAAPVRETDGPASHLIVTVRDVTLEMLQQQKLAAIHQAGMELADLTPDELLQMAVEERIELLKANIVHFTKDLLNFDVVEIRLLDPKTDRLETLLATGMEPEAEDRVLYARPQGMALQDLLRPRGRAICARIRVRIRFI